MRNQRHIVLVGLSGSGKSSVGPVVARALGLPFVDTDREIERRTGRSVQRLFAEEGEPRFRALEAEEVRRVLLGPRAVVALGGGAVLDAASRELIWGRSLVVWLSAEPEELARRLRAQPTDEPRPLLAGAEPAARLRELLETRTPVYGAAHARVVTTHLAAEDAAAAVLAVVARFGIETNP